MTSFRRFLWRCRSYIGGVVLACMFILPGIAKAELGISLRMEHSSFLQFESMFAYVTIENRGMLPFVIDRQGLASGLRFPIRRSHGDLASKTREVPIVTDVRIAPGQSRTLVVDLTKWYDLRESGRYFVQAQVSDGKRAFASATVAIEVVPGIELKKVTRDLFGYDGVTRTYSLRYWARDQAEYLFLRVDESPTGLNYGVFRIGSMVRVFDPELQVDGLGKVKVLHQVNGGVYAVSEFLASRDSLTFTKQSFIDKNMNPLRLDGGEDVDETDGEKE